MRTDQPPVTPDAETAQEWALRELEDPIYDPTSTQGDRFVQWIQDALERLFSIPTGSLPIPLIVGGVLLLVAVSALAWFIVGPARRARIRGEKVAVVDDDPRTAAEMRDAAEAAARGGEWNLAVLERYRGIVRGFEERRVIDDRPGRTAYEAARDAGKALPSHSKPLRNASHAFDAVCYGHRDSSEAEYLRISDVDQATKNARTSVAAYS